MTHQASADFFRRAMLYGDGSYGAGTISSGTTTLTGDRAYTDLTISSTGAINTAGFRLFVNGTLTFSNVSASCIHDDGVAGGNATSASGAASSGAGTDNAFKGNAAGGVGGDGNTTAGAAGNAPTVEYSVLLGGRGASGGAGGNGNGYLGAVSVASLSPTAVAPKVADMHLLYGVTAMCGGNGGVGGSGAGGDGSNSGYGGGSGGNGGGIVTIAARRIVITSCVTAGIISSIGGTGGNGGSSVSGNTGGGGGGGGGAGGYLRLICDFLEGTLTDAINVSGGNGGTGGGKQGTGTTGSGGYGGSPGNYMVVIHSKNIIAYSTASVSMGSPSGTTGGTGTARFYTL